MSPEEKFSAIDSFLKEMQHVFHCLAEHSGKPGHEKLLVKQFANAEKSVMKFRKNLPDVLK